jgi:hypothetical protein
MKKVILLLLFNFTILNAYTLILKDNSIVKGELIKVNNNYTLLFINGEETIVLNSLVKKRFFTPAELERNKQTINDEEIYGIKSITQIENNKIQHKDNTNTSKLNVYANVDLATQITAITNLTYLSSGVYNLNYLIALGLDYSDYFIGESRYTFGGILHTTRTFTYGSYDGNLLYARLEYPFDYKNPNNYVGIEINSFFPNTLVFTDGPFTNLIPKSQVGLAVYERKYYNNIFFESGIRYLSFLAEGKHTTDDVNVNFTTFGLYFLAGMSF